MFLGWTKLWEEDVERVWGSFETGKWLWWVCRRRRAEIAGALERLVLAECPGDDSSVRAESSVDGARRSVDHSNTTVVSAKASAVSGGTTTHNSDGTCKQRSPRSNNSLLLLRLCSIRIQYAFFSRFSRGIFLAEWKEIQTSTTEAESWTSEATRRGSCSGSRASVVTVDVATSGVERYDSHGGSYQVSGALGWSNEGGGTSGCTHGGEWAGGGSYEASWAGTWSTYVLGTFLGSNAVRWSALGSNVSLGSLGRSNVSPATDHSCSTERKVSRHRPTNVSLSLSLPSKRIFVYAPPETICWTPAAPAAAADPAA